ncbi:hypothetical protein L2W42_23560 (plasmid) [Rhizobium gallicum]|nr:hypothetical protein [Rhizobium gallicum]ULJ74366.1 hypothetical protein L2W42_23560 [Rhizobium gallicum]
MQIAVAFGFLPAHHVVCRAEDEGCSPIRHREDRAHEVRVVAGVDSKAQIAFIEHRVFGTRAKYALSIQEMNFAVSSDQASRSHDNNRVEYRSTILLQHGSYRSSLAQDVQRIRQSRMDMFPDFEAKSRM